MLHLIVGILIFIATLGAIIARPWRISEAAAAGAGAVFMLLGGFLGPVEALRVLAGEWNIYGFFLGLMTISAIADRAGIFEALARQTGRLAKGSGRNLLIGVFLAGALVTAFLSNDATALILTPAIYTLVTRLRLPPLPYMFACTFIADTASFLLPVSNPINILILNNLGAGPGVGGLGAYLRYLLLPALFCILANAAIFLFLFRSDLRRTYHIGDLPEARPVSEGFFRFTLAALGLIAVAYVAFSALQLPLSIVSLSGAALLVLGSRRYKLLDWKTLGREISWPLFLFISGMFVIIRGVENLGVTAWFGRELLSLAGSSPVKAALLTSAGSALGANLINNVPMALVMVSAIRSAGTAGPLYPVLVYAAIIGCDLGPNLTTVGSLATMLWLLILRRKGLEVSSFEYFKLGVLIVPVMVLVGALLIWLHL